MKFKNLLYVLAVYNSFLFASQDSFFINLDKDGKFETISSDAKSSINVQILKHYNSAIDRDVESAMLCNTSSQKCFNKYIKCNKGVFFSSENDTCTSPMYSVITAIASTSRDEKGNINTFSTAVGTVILTPLAGMVGTVFIEKKFNDLYNDIINEYKFDENKQKIFSEISSNQIYRPCNVANYKNSQFEISQNGCNRTSAEGLFVYFKDTGFLNVDYSDVLTLDVTRSITASDRNYKFLTMLTSDEADDVFKASRKITQSLVDIYMNIDSIFPHIPLPNVLPQIVLEKSEFEKQSDFQYRKSKVIQEREFEQKKINEEYIMKVKERNEKYFDELRYRDKKIKTKINEFYKEALLALAKKPTFTYLSYDAEHEIVYGYINGIDNLAQKIMFSATPSQGYNIKKNTKSVEVKLLLNEEAGAFGLEKVVIQFDGTTYSAKYTDINYKPDLTTVVIPSYDLAKYKINIENALSNAQNLNQNALIELQNIDKWRIIETKPVIDRNIIRTNAKQPDWYNQMTCAHGQCAAARADTQEEALKKAMAQLGCILDSSIESKLSIHKTKTYGYVDNSREYIIEQKCTTSFDNKDIKILNLEEIDGWYYIKIGF